MKAIRSCALIGFATATLLLGAPHAQALDPGDRAPAFVAPELFGGADVSLSAHKGKVVYLDFWASWCGPCAASLPILDSLRQEFPSDQFQVVAVNVDDDPEKGRRFLMKHPVGYPSAHDAKGRLPETYGVETMPTAFLIDRRGVIRRVYHGFKSSELPSLRKEISRLVAGR